MYCLNKRIGTYGWIEGEDCIWGFCIDRNGLCKINKGDKRGKIEAVYASYDSQAKGLVHSIAHIGDKIVTVPMSANIIGVYDEQKRIMNEVEIAEPERFFKGKFLSGAKFINHVVYDSYIYMFGYHYPGILRLDVNTLKVDYLVDWIDSKILKAGMEHSFLAEGCVRIKNDVFVALRSNAILRLDLTTNETETIITDAPECRADALVMCGENLGIVSWEKDYLTLFLYNLETKAVTKINIAKIADMAKANRYWIATSVSDRTYLLPYIAGEAYMVDITTRRAVVCDKINELLRKNIGRLTPYLAIWLRSDEQKLIFQTGTDFCVYEYDTVSENINNSYYYEIDGNFCYMNYLAEGYAKAQKDAIIHESEMQLSCFLDHIAGSNL